MIGKIQVEPLKPSEVAVVANFSFPYSVELAKHYMAVRGIPARQLLVTGMSREESVNRNDYERTIAGPLRDFLTGEKLDGVRCVVLMYGVPVKVLEPVPSLEDKKTELLIRDERPRRLSAVVALLKETRALAEGGNADSKLLPSFDPHASAEQQIRKLIERLVEDFAAASRRLKAMPAGEARTRLESDWLRLWTRAFGFTPPKVMNLAGAPEPNIPLDRRQSYTRRINELLSRPIYPTAAQEMISLVDESRGTAGVIELCQLILDRVHPDWRHRAAVDSELCTLFWPPFSTAGTAPNPFNIHTQYQRVPRTLMVCRLDGPSADVVRKMIDTSAEVERRGLRGNLCLDARGIEGTTGYAVYDNDLRKLGTMADEFTTLTVQVDNDDALFAPGACPGAALYCGWYSLGKNVDAFRFVPGAVGYHIASTEAMRLRDPQATTWCPSLLRHGVVATLGPVEEPYLSNFPYPSEFFGLLMTGRLPLANCYFMTVPHLSWMMTLIGDPLYNPFAARPAVELNLLPDILLGDDASDLPQ